MRKEGGEGVVSQVKPCIMSYGCGTVVLCKGVLADAQRLISPDMLAGNVAVSQRMLAAI